MAIFHPLLYINLLATPSINTSQCGGEKVNSGIQRPFEFTQPETVDLDVLDQELVTNYTAPVHLTKAFLPHLQKQKAKGQTALVYTSSQLALIPMTRAPELRSCTASLCPSATKPTIQCRRTQGG
jgi:short-subunit dehydrogenase involved in D-alanine esterification of teichoic acids